MNCPHTIRERTYSGDECPACLAADRDKLRTERDTALGRAQDAEGRANDTEGKWRDEIIAAREARDEADRKLEEAKAILGDFVEGKGHSSFDPKVNAALECAEEFLRTRDSRQSSGAEMCECGHEAADHEYSRVSDDGQTAWYHPIRCRKCECKKPTLCKRR